MQFQETPGAHKQGFSLFLELDEKPSLRKTVAVVRKDDMFVTIRINDTDLTDKIIDAYLDRDNRIILYNMRSQMTITEIVKKANLPQSSVYRKVDALVEQGLILFSGFDKNVKNGKGNHKGSIYEKTVHSISFNLKSDTHTAELTIERRVLQKCKPLYLSVIRSC